MPPLTDEMMEHAQSLLLFGMLPALGMAIYMMATVTLLCGAKRAPLAAALAVGTGVALGLWVHAKPEARDLALMKLISGDSSWNRLLWAALAAMWIGRVARLDELQPSAGWLLRAAAAVAIALLVVPASNRKEVDWLAPVFAIVILAHWLILERLATETRDGGVPFCLAVCFLAASIVLVHANSGRVVEVSIVMASALAALAPVAWWRRVDAGGAIPATAVLLPGLLLFGQQETYSELPWYVFALPACAPLLLAEALPWSQWQGALPRLGRFFLMLIVVLVPLAVAVYLAEQLAPMSDVDGM